jgi:hypothetical protein
MGPLERPEFADNGKRPIRVLEHSIEVQTGGDLHSGVPLPPPTFRRDK